MNTTTVHVLFMIMNVNTSPTFLATSPVYTHMYYLSVFNTIQFASLRRRFPCRKTILSSHSCSFDEKSIHKNLSFFPPTSRVNRTTQLILNKQSIIF